MSSLMAHGKMARTKTKTQNNTKTRLTPRRNRYLEKTMFCKAQFIKPFTHYSKTQKYTLNTFL